MPDREFIAHSFYEGMTFHLKKNYADYVIKIHVVDRIDGRLSFLWEKDISTLLEADMVQDWKKNTNYTFRRWASWVKREEFEVTLLDKREPDWEI